ncbi:MAG: lipid-transfer protein, partial [Mycobacteriales bacterium]
MRRDVAVVGYAEFHTPAEERRNEVEMLMPVLAAALAEAGLEQGDIGFTVSGSSDYLQGQPFAFVTALDAVGAWPPIRESHLEMDGAFALYEAVQVLQDEDIDTALVYAFGKPSRGDLERLLALQLDPYLVAPLWPDASSMAALQARALLDSGRFTERDFAEVAARATGADPDELLARPYHAEPLRAHDVALVVDGAAAVVLAAGDRARAITDRPAWIRGIDHRIEPASLGARDLTATVSARLAARAAGVADVPGAAGADVGVAELHALYSHQELLLRDALGLGRDTLVNP